MKRKKHGVKIKHSKSLYRKRKGTFRKTMEIAGVIILAGALCLLGFACGRPIMEYLNRDRPAETTLGWTPPEETVEITEDSRQESVLPEQTEPAEPLSVINGLAYYAPTSALQNKTSLASYLVSAKAEGYSYVVIDLKDSVGNIWYKSNLEQLQGKEYIKGDMSLSDIYSVFSDNGIKPIIRISTLMDRSAPKEFEHMSYWFSDQSYKWLDDRADNGGKLWADPTKPQTVEYLQAISAEIRAAGFEEIILSNTVFPVMRPYDLGVLPSNVTSSARYTALVNVVNACADQKPVYIEMDLLDIVQNNDGFAATAEVLRGQATLEDCKIVAIYKKHADTAENTAAPALHGSIAEQITYLYGQAEKNVKGAEIIPCIENEGLSDAEIEAAIKTLNGMGYTNIMVK